MPLRRLITRMAGLIPASGLMFLMSRTESYLLLSERLRLNNIILKEKYATRIQQDMKKQNHFWKIILEKEQMDLGLLDLQMLAMVFLFGDRFFRW